MQSTADTEDRIDTARWEIDAIASNVDDADKAQEVILHLNAALKNPDAAVGYVENAQDLLRELMDGIDPDGPYYQYARRARDELDAILSGDN